MRPGLDLPWPSVMVPPSAAQPTLDSTGAQPSKLFVRELADGARVESACSRESLTTTVWLMG